MQTQLQLTPAASASRPGVYAAVWRWHFYCGLICVPFVLWLAITGSLYLFHHELELIRYPGLINAPAAQSELAPTRSVVAAEQHVAGRALFFRPADRPSRSTEVVVRDRRGGLVTVFLNASDASVQGVWQGARLGDLLRSLHGLSVLGRGASHAIEAVPGLAIVMVCTGIYLWWPRAAGGGVLRVTAPRASRRWWRELHAVIGVFAAALLLFFALTALPWTPLSGGNLSRLARDAGLGAPAYVWDGVPQSNVPLSAPGALPWTLEGERAPRVEPAHTAPIGLDRVVDWARSHAIPPGFSVRLPEGEDDVYTITSFPKDRALQRVVHLDQYSGAVLVSIGFADYGAIAKVVEWGVGTHSGEQYGEFNRWLMFAGCLALIVLSVSGAAMWWMRRPRRALAPPPRAASRTFRLIGLCLAPLGLALPMLGISLLLIAAVDWTLTRRHASGG